MITPDEDDSSTVDEAAPPGPSAVAQELESLKETILRVAEERERLPQPLFWSLFNARLKGIRKTKELQRLLAGLEGVGE